MEMSSFTDNDTFGTPPGQGYGRERSSYYTSTPRQQNAPVVDNSSCSELHWAGGPHRESYAPAGLASNLSPWSSTAFPDPSSEGGVWPGDQRFEDLLSTTGGNAHGSGMDLMGMEVAAPVSGQAFPAAPRALPPFRSYPPFTNWPQAPGPSWQPTSSWDHPVHTVRERSDQSSSVGSLAMRPLFQPTTSSVTTAQSERRLIPSGPLPSITTPHSVQPSTSSDPVPVSLSVPRSRGERWNLSNETTFQCMWTSRCTALIAGDRRSVTNHLREVHNFACDGQVIACAWGECQTYMQRRNIPRHIVACHFAIKVTCPHCGLSLSRADANKKHLLACTSARTSVVTVEATEENEGGYF